MVFPILITLIASSTSPATWVHPLSVSYYKTIKYNNVKQNQSYLNKTKQTEGKEH